MSDQLIGDNNNTGLDLLKLLNMKPGNVTTLNIALFVQWTHAAIKQDKNPCCMQIINTLLQAFVIGVGGKDNSLMYLSKHTDVISPSNGTGASSSTVCKLVQKMEVLIEE